MPLEEDQIKITFILLLPRNVTYEKQSRISDFQFITNNMQITVGYKTVIFFLISRECETWPLILRGELWLRENVKMVPTLIFVVKNKYV